MERLAEGSVIQATELEPWSRGTHCRRRLAELAGSEGRRCFTFEGQNWVITDAKALSERDVDFEIHIRRVEEE